MTPAVPTTVGLRPSLARPGAPCFPGVESPVGSINKASPRVWLLFLVFLDRPGEGLR